MGMKADSAWPEDTTQSEDTGARQESVSRSSGRCDGGKGRIGMQSERNNC